jgi:hypothetical protein
MSGIRVRYVSLHDTQRTECDPFAADIRGTEIAQHGERRADLLRRRLDSRPWRGPVSIKTFGGTSTLLVGDFGSFDENRRQKLKRANLCMSK